MASPTAMCLLCLCLLAQSAMGQDCCPGGYLLENEQTCQGNVGSTQLNCPRGKFQLNPHEEEDDVFRVDVSGLVVGPDEGLYTIPNGTFCLTQLLTSDKQNLPVALVCFEEELSLSTGMVRHYVNGVCLFVSAAFLLATLLVYGVLAEVRDLEGKCVMGYVLSLAIAYITLGLLQFHGHFLFYSLCVGQAFFLYFWMLSAFFWLNVVSFNVWRSTIRLRLPVSECRLFYVYCCYALSLPFLFLTVALITEHVEGGHLKPNFGVMKCWFQGPVETWVYFYGPIAILLTCNLVFFMWAVVCLWRDYANIQVNGRLRSMRFKCMLYLKMSILMGITWIFELISFMAGDRAPFFWYVTDILNCLQGVIIFLLVVVCRKRVMRGLIRRKPWGMKLPHHWAQGVDEESEAILGDDDISHTQLPMEDQPKPH